MKVFRTQCQWRIRKLKVRFNILLGTLILYNLSLKKLSWNLLRFPLRLYSILFHNGNWKFNFSFIHFLVIIWYMKSYFCLLLKNDYHFRLQSEIVPPWDLKLLLKLDFHSFSNLSQRHELQYKLISILHDIAIFNKMSTSKTI